MIETPSEQIRPAVVRVSGRRETILKLFLFGFSLIMVCCLTEFASWLYLKQHFGKFGYSLQVQSLGSMAENAYQVWEDPANYTNWSLRAHFDEHGLRYPTPVSVQKPVGVRRIFILGGSMAYGSQPSGMWQKFSGQRELAIN